MKMFMYFTLYFILNTFLNNVIKYFTKRDRVGWLFINIIMKIVTNVSDNVKGFLTEES